MTEKETTFENLRRAADSIFELFGKNCEVAIHDFENFQKSLIYIRGSITKRKPGAPVTDLIVKDLKEKGDDIEDNRDHRTITADGIVIKSSTTFIRDSSGKVMGAFCVHYNITEFLNAVSLIENFVGQAGSPNQSRKETFATSVSETIDSLLSEGVGQIGRQPVTMTKDEKIELVRLLEEKGAFMLKGAVEQVAQAMGITKFSVYNYIKKIRGKEKK